MRILHVVPSLSQKYGGPLRAVLDLSARSLELGLDSEVVGFGDLEVPDNPLPREKIHRLPAHFPKRYCYSRELPRWIRENLKSYQGVVLHGMWLYPNWAFAKACKQHGIPYACFPHGMLEPWSVFGQGVWKDLKKRAYWAAREKYVFSNATALFFTTERERRLAAITFPLPLNSHVVVPYGIDMSEHEEAGAPANLVAGPYALFLSRVHPKKNVEFLIDTWAAAAPPKDWQLVIAGPGDPAYLRHLKERSVQLGLQDRIVFPGLVTGEKKRSLFRNAKWFLLPSSQENFGIAVLEAVSLGCPVAISDQVYLSDHFHRDSEVIPVIAADWIRFFRERMTDEVWRRKVMARDRAELMPRFRFDRVVRDWVDTLESAFGRPDGPANARIAASCGLSEKTGEV